MEAAAGGGDSGGGGGGGSNNGSSNSSSPSSQKDILTAQLLLKKGKRYTASYLKDECLRNLSPSDTEAPRTQVRLNSILLTFLLFRDVFSASHIKYFKTPKKKSVGF